MPYSIGTPVRFAQSYKRGGVWRRRYIRGVFEGAGAPFLTGTTTGIVRMRNNRRKRVAISRLEALTNEGG